MIIKLEKVDYQSRVAKKMKEYSKKAMLKGFRPGNVPLSFIQKIYGRSIVTEEINSLLAESVAQYLKENDIHALGKPMPVFNKMEPLDVDNQEGFEFEYIIGMAGELTCEISKDLKVIGYKIVSVANHTIDHFIEELCKLHGKIEVVEKSSVRDVVHGVLYYPAQDFKVQTKIVIEEVAEEARGSFINLNLEDEMTFDIENVLGKGTRLPDITDKMQEAMLRLGGQAKFTVQQIHRMLPAALEQTFFDKVLGAGLVRSEKDFRERMQARVMENKQQEANHCLSRAIKTTLLKNTTVALPDSLLKKWLQEQANTMPKEQLEIYYQQYAEELKWSLLVKKISKKYGLQVIHEEVVEEIQYYFRSTLNDREISCQQLSEKEIEKMTQQFIAKNNGENYEKMYKNMQIRKLIDFVKDQITIVTQEVSAEAFDKLSLK